MAYISYNTYPGWHFRDVVRGMMRYHARGQTDALVQAREGRKLVEFLSASVPAKNAYGAILKQEVDVIANVADWYLCHDHMAEVNQPFYFHEFAQQATTMGLQYLGEAIFSSMLPRGLPAEVVSRLASFSDDIVAQQQYLDFVRATPFRHSLLCRQAIRLNRSPGPACLEQLHVAAQAQAKPEQFDVKSAEMVTFTGPGGTLNSNRPLMKAAMACLTEIWPRTIPFAQLCAKAGAMVNPSPLRLAEQIRAERETLAGIIIKGCFTSDLLELHAAPVVLCTTISERPLASPLARLQAQRQALATSLRHETVRLGEVERRILPWLDGQTDRGAMVERLRDLAAQGTLVLQKDLDNLQRSAAIERALDSALAEVARHALLIA